MVMATMMCHDGADRETTKGLRKLLSLWQDMFFGTLEASGMSSHATMLSLCNANQTHNFLSKSILRQMTPIHRGSSANFGVTLNQNLFQISNKIDRNVEIFGGLGGQEEADQGKASHEGRCKMWAMKKVGQEEGVHEKSGKIGQEEHGENRGERSGKNRERGGWDERERGTGRAGVTVSGSDWVSATCRGWVQGSLRYYDTMFTKSPDKIINVTTTYLALKCNYLAFLAIVTGNSSADRDKDNELT
ncbi:hypothetical protein EI94DRAFT_1700530 [Lactarius quietus]|nr:hypothetical protein EI94DRAFT_1700530 [Lactarius quietus]